MKYFVRKNLVWRCMLILNFGVSTTILNPVQIFCRWYKLNFGLLQGQVKFYHFYEWIESKRQYFYFLYKFIGIIGWKRHWTTILDTDLDSFYLLNRIGFDWHLKDVFWIKNIPSVATNNIKQHNNTTTQYNNIAIFGLFATLGVLRSFHF